MCHLRIVKLVEDLAVAMLKLNKIDMKNLLGKIRTDLNFNDMTRLIYNESMKLN